MWRIAAVFAATGALALSGCTSNDEGAGTSTTTTAASADKVDSIASTVPEDIKSSGKLIIGVNIPYAPNEFKDPSGEIVGFDVDLMNAIASTLGLTPEYREADFSKIIPSIQGGTYNVGMSSFTDTKEREQSVDFVTYFSAGTLWAQRPDNPVDPTNACGKKVAVQATTYQETDELPAKSKACTEAGQSRHRDHLVRQPGRCDQRRRFGPGGRHVGGLASHLVCDQADQRQARGGRRDLRRRALRLAGGQGVRAGPVAAAGLGAPHRDR